MDCPNCGTGNRERARFCEKCGTGLLPSDPVQPPPYQNPMSYGQQMPAVAETGRIRRPQSAQPAQPSQLFVQDSAAKRYAEGKNPTVALLLSLFLPDIGQIYNGDIKKCLVMWGILFICLILAAPSGGFTGLLAFGVWVWSMIDAYNVASRKSPLW